VGYPAIVSRRTVLVAALGCLTLARGALASTDAASPTAATPAPAAPVAPEPPPESPPTPSPGFEAGRTILQFALGSGTSVLGIFVASAAFEGGGEKLGIASFFAVPLLVGATVNGVGNAGAHRGSYAASALGAYIGAATIVPLTYLGYRADQRRYPESFQSDEPFIGPGTLGGLAAGWLILQPLASTLAWHLSKTPKRSTGAVAAPFASCQPASASASARRRRTRAPGQRVLPVITVAF
jgi:hypothetical protein